MAGIGEMLAGLFSGPVYQSQGGVVDPGPGKPINWGDPNLAADFFRADQANTARNQQNIPLPPRRPAGLGGQPAAPAPVTTASAPAAPAPYLEPGYTNSTGRILTNALAGPEPGYSGQAGALLANTLAGPEPGYSGRAGRTLNRALFGPSTTPVGPMSMGTPAMQAGPTTAFTPRVQDPSLANIFAEMAAPPEPPPRPAPPQSTRGPKTEETRNRLRNFFNPQGR